MKRWLLLLAASALLGGCVTTTYRQADGYYVGGSPYGNADTVIYRDGGGYGYPYGYGYDPYYSGYLPGFGYVPPAYYSGVVYGGAVVVYRDYDRHYHHYDRPQPVPRSYDPRQPQRINRWDARRPPPPVNPAERRWPARTERPLPATPLRTWQGEPRPQRLQAPSPLVRSAGAPRPVRQAPPHRFPPRRREREH